MTSLFGETGWRLAISDGHYYVDEILDRRRRPVTPCYDDSWRHIVWRQFTPLVAIAPREAAMAINIGEIMTTTYIVYYEC